MQVVGVATPGGRRENVALQFARKIGEPEIG
jgi:hypothetical protein